MPLSAEVLRNNSNDRQHDTAVPSSDFVQKVDVRISSLQSRQPNLDSPNVREHTVKPDLGSKEEVFIPSNPHWPLSKPDSTRDVQRNIATPNVLGSTLPAVLENARTLKNCIKKVHGYNQAKVHILTTSSHHVFQTLRLFSQHNRLSNRIVLYTPD